MKQICTLIGFLLMYANISFAQQFGGFPPSTKWKQINSDTVRVIFTPGAEWQAQRIATIIHKTASDSAHALGSRLRKINVLLHNRTTLANGYVALGPFRSEFFLVPGTNPFDFGNIPWYETLAIHEYRHVHQYNNFRNGISKAMSIIFGEQGQALANALTIPDWFFEGDAVLTETAVT
ncbi:MAG: TolB family protein, partial [Flavisolibacter sp.]